MKIRNLVVAGALGLTVLTTGCEKGARVNLPPVDVQQVDTRIQTYQDHLTKAFDSWIRGETELGDYHFLESMRYSWQHPEIDRLTFAEASEMVFYRYSVEDRNTIDENSMRVNFRRLVD